MRSILGLLNVLSRAELALLSFLIMFLFDKFFLGYDFIYVFTKLFISFIFKSESFFLLVKLWIVSYPCFFGDLLTILLLRTGKIFPCLYSPPCS